MSQAWPAAVPPEQQQQENSDIASTAPRSCVLDEGMFSAQDAIKDMVGLLLNKNSNEDDESQGKIDAFQTRHFVEMKAESSSTASKNLLTSATGQLIHAHNKTTFYQGNSPDEVCRNFNSGIDCTYWLTQCTRNHICSSCHSTSHGAHECITLSVAVSDLIEDKSANTASATLINNPQPFNAAQVAMPPVPLPSVFGSTSNTLILNPQPLTAAQLSMWPVNPPPFCTHPGTGMPTYYSLAPAHWINTNTPAHICSPFNAPTGCDWPTCRRRHVCSNCHSPNHTLPACTNYPEYVCEKFNSDYGCLFSHCQRRHVCNNCHSSAHSVTHCSNYPEFACEKFNKAAGCLWAGCKRRHVCSQCGEEGHGAAVCEALGG